MGNFKGVPPHLRSAELGVESWICDPPGMLNRMQPGYEVTEGAALWITQRVNEVMRGRYAGGEKCVYIHDFSQTPGYTSGARKLLTEWGIHEMRAGVVEVVYIVPPPLNRMFVMGVSTALAVLRAAGMKIDMIQDAHTAVERHRLFPARMAATKR